MNFNEEKILKAVIKFGLFLVFIIPLVYLSKFFFPFIVPKNLFFRLIVEVIFALYICLAFKYPRYRPKLNFLNIAVLAYFSILLITSLTGVNFLRSFWGNYERMDGLLNQFHLLLYFIVLVSTLKDRKEWYQLFSFSLGAAFMMTMFALGQKLNFSFLIHTDNIRLAGTIGNASFFASYLVFHFFFILLFLFKTRRFQIKTFLTSVASLEILFILFVLSKGAEVFKPIIFSGSFAIFFLSFNALIVGFWLWHKKRIVVFSFLLLLLWINAFVLFNTGTRGALLGVIAGVFFILFTLAIQGSKKRKIVAVVILVLGIALGATIFLNKDNDWVKNNPTLANITSTSFKSITVESRLITWQSSWQAVTDNPFRFVFGYGVENYDTLFDKYFNPKIIRDTGSRIWFDRAHNLVFDLWVNSGLLGLLAFLSILSTAVFYLFKIYLKSRQSNRDLFLVFSALFVGYFIQNLFVFDTLNTYILLWLSVAFCGAVFSSQFSSTRFKFWSDKSIDTGVFGKTAIVGVLIFVVWFFNVRIVLANTNLVKGALYDRVGVPKQEAFGYFQKALDFGFIGRFEAVQQLSGFARDVAGDENLPKDFSFEVAQRTIEEFEKNIELDPSNVKHYLYLGSLYNDILTYFNDDYPQVTFGWPQKVVDLVDEASSLSPTRPQLYFVKARALAYQQKNDEAIIAFKEGIKLVPNMVQYRVDLVVLYLIIGESELARQELEEFDNSRNKDLSFSFRDYARLAQVYETLGIYDQVPEMYVKLISRTSVEDSNYVSYHAKAAAAFARIGDNESASEWALKVLEIDPSSGPDIQGFLERLDAGEFLDQDWVENNAKE